MDCFRTCDLRGIYPNEIDEPLFYRLGQEIAFQHLSRDTSVLIGCDWRLSSPPLREALLEGLVESGARVLDAGAVPTPLIYFGKRRLGLGTAAVVTASHNPPEYNGLKLLLENGPASPEQIVQLRRNIRAARFKRPGGSVESVNLMELYQSHTVANWGRRFAEPRSRAAGPYVLDPGNGVWSGLAVQIFRALGIRCQAIHDEPDGTFPNRSPDCAAPGSLSRLATSVRQSHAAAGIAWDGDGDRLAICDDTGAVLSTDRLALLLIPELAPKDGQDRILLDVKMSRKVKAAVESRGAIPLVEKSAHCLLEQTMIRENCLFGCEYSGHLFFRELGGSDDGMHSALVVVDFLERSGSLLSQLVERLPKIFATPDIRFPGGAREFHEIERRVLDGLPQARIQRLDGLMLELPRAWFVLRRSASEKKLSWRFEADTADDLHSLVHDTMILLPQYRDLLATGLAGQ